MHAQCTPASEMAAMEKSSHGLKSKKKQAHQNIVALECFVLDKFESRKQNFRPRKHIRAHPSIRNLGQKDPTEFTDKCGQPYAKHPQEKNPLSSKTFI